MHCSLTLSGISTSRDNGIMGFDITYILYQKLLCLLLVCTSPSLLGISILSQEGVKTLWSVSSD